MGQFAKEESDPITCYLYVKICTASVYKGLIFLWVFKVLHWKKNGMTRSININNLRFKCFLVKDSIDTNILIQERTRKVRKNPFQFLFAVDATALEQRLCLNDEQDICK